MAQKGSGLLKAAFDTDNVLMRFSEKVLDIVTANLLFLDFEHGLVETNFSYSDGHNRQTRHNKE